MMHSPINPRRGRAQLLCVFLILGIAVDALGLLLNFIYVAILPNTVAGDLIVLGEASWFDLLEGITGLLELAIRLTTIVLFLLWIYRASQNLLLLCAQNIEFTPGWAVGWFFIPVANLFIPYRVMKEIWIKSDPQQSGESSWQSSGSTPLLGWWWGIWLLSCFLNQAVFRLSRQAETPDMLFVLAKVEIIAGAFNIAAGFLAYLVVKGISNRQAERSKRYQTSYLPPPPPIFAPP